jgi:hypothetical protein
MVHHFFMTLAELGTPHQKHISNRGVDFHEK